VLAVGRSRDAEGGRPANRNDSPARCNATDLKKPFQHGVLNIQRIRMFFNLQHSRTTKVRPHDTLASL
jgi:hypothetical protein